MKNHTDKNVAAAVTKLLEEERAVLLSGKLEGLEDLIERKEQLLDALDDDTKREPTEFAQIQALATQNQALLESAMHGIQSVASRLATIRQLRETLFSYDEKGQRQSRSLSKGQALEKRA